MSTVWKERAFYLWFLSIIILNLTRPITGFLNKVFSYPFTPSEYMLYLSYLYVGLGAIFCVYLFTLIYRFAERRVSSLLAFGGLLCMWAYLFHHLLGAIETLPEHFMFIFLVQASWHVSALVLAPIAACALVIVWIWGIKEPEPGSCPNCAHGDEDAKSAPCCYCEGYDKFEPIGSK